MKRKTTAKKQRPKGPARTRKTKTEQALERYTEVFDFAPIGYATLDRHGTILEINRAGAQLLSGEHAAFIGARFLAFLSPAAHPEFDALLTTVLTHATPASCELELRRNQILVPVRITAALLVRDQPRVLLAFEDISERRAKEIVLAHTELALRDMNRRKDEFLAMLSHELRNPLSPIRTSVEVLRLAEPGSEAANSAIGIIDRAASHLARLVDDLLDVTRIMRGKIELRREPVELIALIERTLDDHRAAFAEHRLRIETRFAVPRLWMFGDVARLVQVLSNVLGNSEKFTPSGGTITVGVEHVDHYALITLKDTGVGIAPDVIGELFEPFAQAPQALDRNRGGLGLGLTMVRSLVELHGGHVSIHSAGIGRGTEVVITLPAETTRPSTHSDPAASHAQRRRILIVEDMRDTALSLQQALRLKGHEVHVAHTGKAGLDLTLQLEPDVVLCDLGLPDIDGFAFAMDVRRRASSPPYLVALSGYARPEDVERAKAAGFNRHLAKPAQLDELDRMLATLATSPRGAAGDPGTLQ